MTSSRNRRSFNHGQAFALPSPPKVGAVCLNWARTDLCGGRGGTCVPTAIPRNTGLREVVRRTNAGSRPTLCLGKADDIVEETGKSTRCTAGVRDPASKEGLSEITSGSCREQQGLGTTCKDSRNEAKNRRKRELNGSGT